MKDLRYPCAGSAGFPHLGLSKKKSPFLGTSLSFRIYVDREWAQSIAQADFVSSQ